MNSRYREESIDAIDPLETMPPAKKSMVIFFLVDTSKSCLLYTSPSPRDRG